jgi:hypothetical protein
MEQKCSMNSKGFLVLLIRVEISVWLTHILLPPSPILSHIPWEIHFVCWVSCYSVLHGLACLRRVSGYAHWSGRRSPECVALHILWEFHSVEVVGMGW